MPVISIYDCASVFTIVTYMLPENMLDANAFSRAEATHHTTHYVYMSGATRQSRHHEFVEMGLITLDEGNSIYKITDEQFVLFTLTYA